MIYNDVGMQVSFLYLFFTSFCYLMIKLRKVWFRQNYAYHYHCFYEIIKKYMICQL
jgi:hypothetical protein